MNSCRFEVYIVLVSTFFGLQKSHLRSVFCLQQSNFSGGPTCVVIVVEV